MKWVQLVDKILQWKNLGKENGDHFGYDWWAGIYSAVLG